MDYVTATNIVRAICIMATCIHSANAVFNRCLLGSNPVRSATQFSSAEDVCVGLGGRVLTVKSHSDFTLIKKLFQQRGVTEDVYLGANDRVFQQIYQWSDGDLVSDWSKFHTGSQPTTDRYPNCIRMSYSNDWKWYDNECRDQFAYLCEKQIVPYDVDFGDVCSLMLASPASRFSTPGTTLILTEESIVEIECKDGYRLKPTSRDDVSCLSCESEPVDFEDMSCEEIPCEAFTVANAIDDYNHELVYDETANVGCQHTIGYLSSQGTENFTVRCDFNTNSDVTYLSNLLTCNEVTCPNLEVDHSDSSGTSGSYSETRTVTCDHGYETASAGQKSFDVTCHIPDPVVNNGGHFGAWDGLTECSGMPCATLSVDHASVATANNRYTETSLVTCDKNNGYLTADGSETFTVTCDVDNAEQTFLDGVETCEFVSCPTVTVPNSDTSGATGDFGQTHTVICNLGYQWRNDGTALFTMTCDIPNSPNPANGHLGYWKDKKTCQKKPCPTLNIDHSSLSNKNGKLDESFSGSCDHGFEFSPGQTAFSVSCVLSQPANGDVQWQGLETCKGKSCPMLTVVGGAITNNQLTMSEQTEVVCDTAAGLLTPDGEATFTVTCDINTSTDTMFLDNVKSCDIVSCASISIPNSDISDVSGGFGTEVSVQCDVGYKTTTQGTAFIMQCSLPADLNSIEPLAAEFGVWQNNLGCYAIPCPLLNVLNSNAINITEGYGYAMTATCNDGYHVTSGQKTLNLVCELVNAEQAEWSGTGACIAMPCPALTVNGGTVEDPTLLFNEQTNVICDSANGYLTPDGRASFSAACVYNPLNGQAELQNVTTCEVVTCDPFTDGHSDTTSVLGTFGDVVTVTCDVGYDVAGGVSFDIECLIPSLIGAGEWHGIDQCRAIPCPDLEVLRSNISSGASGNHSNEVSVLCDPGYHVQDQQTVFVVTCGPPSVPGGAQGVWQDLRTCTEIPCETILVANGMTGDADIVYLEETVVRCDRENGYLTPLGDEEFTVRCVLNGTDVMLDNMDTCDGAQCQSVLMNHTDKSGIRGKTGDRELITCVDGYYVAETNRFDFIINCSLPSNITNLNSSDGDLGLWFGVKRCDVVSCSTLMVDHSDTVAAEGNFTDYLTVTCTHGYHVVEGQVSFNTTCGAPVPSSGTNGAWLDLQSCDAMPCSAMFVNNSDAESGANASFTKSATVSCDQGYHVQNGVTSFVASCVLDVSTPEIDVTWSGASDCKAMPCPDLSVSGALPHARTIWFGDQVTVTCDREKGYLTPDGDDSFLVTCIHNGTHAVLEDVLTCESVWCDDPNIAHANSTNVSAMFGEKVFISCDPGYQMTGWQAQSQLRCSIPLQPSLHTAQQSEQELQLSSRKTREAVYRSYYGQWETIPVCTVKPCRVLEIPDASGYSTQLYYGDSSQATCDEQFYTLDGGKTFNVTCQLEGIDAVLENIQDCIEYCHAATLPNSNITEVRVPAGHHVPIGCEEGFILSSPGIVLCSRGQNDGAALLYHPNPACLPAATNTYVIGTQPTTAAPAKFCPYITIPNSDGESITGVTDHHVIVTCKPGYHVIEGQTQFVIKCDVQLGSQFFGEWERIRNCTAMPCPDLSIKGASQYDESLRYKENTTVYCDPDHFTPGGKDYFNVTCTSADGEPDVLLQNLDTCIEHCQPLTLPYSNVSNVRIPVGRHVPIGCDNGAPPAHPGVAVCTRLSYTGRAQVFNPKPACQPTTTTSTITLVTSYNTTNATAVEDSHPEPWLKWNVWTSWSKCSTGGMCGVGTHFRVRVCRDEGIGGCRHILRRRDGQGQIGFSFNEDSCGKEVCPSDGFWTMWTSWSSCSSTCDTGTMARSRNCLGPWNGGHQCEGDEKERATCTLGKCAYHRVNSPGKGETVGVSLLEKKDKWVMWTPSDYRKSAVTIGVAVWGALGGILALLFILDLPTYIRLLRDLFSYICQRQSATS